MVLTCEWLKRISFDDIFEYTPKGNSFIRVECSGLFFILLLRDIPQISESEAGSPLAAYLKPTCV